MSRGLMVLALLLAGCGISAIEPAPELALEAPVYIPQTPTSPPTSTEAPGSSTATTLSVPPVTGWTAAEALGEVSLYPVPNGQTPVRAVSASTVLGTPTVFLVLNDGPDGWLKVLVPGRPNNARAWIQSDDVELFEVRQEIVVDLTDRTLEVRDFSGKIILESDVAIGTPASPTPTGTFFITDAIALSNPGGPWGPYAFGLSARSETITEFNGGDGIIGIHGTNRPSSIGNAASLGCIRLPNEVITELWSTLEVGVPVTIRE